MPRTSSSNAAASTCTSGKEGSCPVLDGGTPFFFQCEQQLSIRQEPATPFRFRSAQPFSMLSSLAVPFQGFEKRECNWKLSYGRHPPPVPERGHVVPGRGLFVPNLKLSKAISSFRRQPPPLSIFPEWATPFRFSGTSLRKTFATHLSKNCILFLEGEPK